MISVVFCHHKGTLIDKALDSAVAQDTRGINFEIIVITSDLHYRYVHPLVKVVSSEGGPAKKRNIALHYANGDYIAFYDDDTELDKDSVYRMYEAMCEHNVGMVFGKLLNMEFRNQFDEAGGFLTFTGFIWARAQNELIDNGQFDSIEPIFAGKSAACMIKRNLFSKVGLFDETFGILGEETDLAWRVWLAGYIVLFVPSSVTYHAFNTKYKPVDFYTHKRVYFNGCRNYITMLCSNLELKNAIKIVPIHVLCWVIAGLGMLLRGKFSAAFYIFKGLLYNIINPQIILDKRKNVRKLRIVSDDNLFKIVYRKIGISYYAKRLLRYWRTGMHG